ncbi:MAG: hypothetical protein SRB1_03059 [Desulfobacteraceae bacterium Eth-SRB1]|nr:MAG: hypothetical protein SRB1_03059 [Desulfobacteraceae bacterium Eth-SRB1]
MDKKPKILIVEDERIIALEMRHKLESMGYDISAIISSGEDAVKKAESLRPDLVLMDIILQGEMDGVEAAGQIRTRFDIPVVYVTANVSDAGLEDITRSEPFGCLFKPFKDIELQAAVEIALHKYKMDKKLRECEEKYRNLFEKAKDAILIIYNRKFVDCNQAAIEMLRYNNKDELLNTHPSELSPEKQPDGKMSFTKADEMMKTAFKNGGHRFEWYHKKSDGEIFPVEVSLTAISDDKNNQILHTIWRDITERKQTEKALRDSEKKYRTLAETTNDVIFVLDLDGKFTYISPVVERLTGYSWQDLIGHPFTEIIVPEYVESTVEHFKKGIDRRNISLYEIEVKHKDGRTVPTELNVSSLLDATGEITGRIGIARNITERKEAEEEVKSNREHLALINQILRHDLTNDLVVMKSSLNLYKVSREKALLEEAEDRVKKSLSLINRMRELEFFISRHSKLKPYKINDVIDETIKNYPFIDFEIKGRGQVMADDSLASVIDNIAGNAVIHGKADRITITADKKRDMCEVRIADNGTGIPDDIKANIFEEGFMHGDTGHTGMGLHIVQKAMENYGGYAYVEDNKPKGAVFVLRFRRVK